MDEKPTTATEVLKKQAEGKAMVEEWAKAFQALGNVIIEQVTNDIRRMLNGREDQGSDREEPRAGREE